MKVLVTGSAGFIGNHVALRLLSEGHAVVGLDNFTPYYDVSLKEARAARLTPFADYVEERVDLADEPAVRAVFDRHRPDRVVHLAAQAGVRYSLENPRAYVDSNLIGTFSILEGCRATAVEHLVFASTSSVYGANREQPFSEHHPADHPLTFYAATKRATEMMAHSYANIYDLPCTALRFFTVYGPWGRPDMALFLFAEAMMKGDPIKVFNHGEMIRDFTYIDDIVDGILKSLNYIPAAVPHDKPVPDPATSPVGPFQVFNIGNTRPIKLMHYIELLEDSLGIKAKKDMLPMQLGDVPGTWADVSLLSNATGYMPKTSVEDGVRNFVAWYRDFYGK
ncbi:NAD-dependent epimerase [Rhodospirillum sp. A1_3_36]|uniref:NAD-dependent epimerase n=1 Tax=Rhodospirillum sp. A1_3_36 TaxID=3391666 RepID=UPI0039A4CE14